MHLPYYVPWKVAVSFGMFKGAVLSVMLASLDVAFWKQIIIVLIGASVTSIGVIVAAVIAARATERNRIEIEHVKRALHADRRAGDGL